MELLPRALVDGEGDMRGGRVLAYGRVRLEVVVGERGDRDLVRRLVEHRDAEQGRVVAPRDLAWVRGKR